MVIATSNPGKAREMRTALERAGLEILTREHFNSWPQVEETGQTLEENARIKAFAFLEAFGVTALADDSGLMVDPLGGRPGVHSSRYAGPGGDAAANTRLLLKELEGVPPGERTARFVCVLALALPGGAVFLSTGECRGEILTAPRGRGGFGYDPVFRPEGYSISMAQMSTEEKNSISHRGRALEEMAWTLDRLLEGESG